jgi:16S rRNA (cytidine1402-2'-O)-methyltransferase
MQNKSEGILYIVSTPIGNLEDITLRALRILKEVDLIAAEDTRRTRQLLTHYGIHKPLISYHEHNQKMREDTLLEKLRTGKQIALVTDAGTPGISDPGTPLIHRAAQEGILLVPIPGPSAAIAGLSISGLPTESFLFYGFLPAKASARKKFLAALKKRPETLIFYESPRRLTALLQEALAILGNRQVVVTREITKIFEETFRGTIGDVLGKIGGEEVKGEITVVLAGNREEEIVSISSIRAALQEQILNSGACLKEAIERVSENLGVAKREVYRESLRLKKENPEGADNKTCSSE